MGLVEAAQAEVDAEKKRHNEAILEEDERHADTMEKLQAIVEMAKGLPNGNGPAPEPPPDSGPGRSDPPAPPPSPPRGQNPPSRPPERRKPADNAVEARESAILAYLRAAGGKRTSKEIIAAVEAQGHRESSIRGSISKMAADGAIEAHGHARSRAYAAPAEPGEGDKPEPPPLSRDDKIKTEIEQAVVDHLAVMPRTAGGLAVKLKLRQADLERVLSSLVVRGVLRRKTVKTSAQPLFEVVK